MAINREVRHNSLDNAESIGEVKVILNESMGLQITVNGAMHDPAFLEMAHGYLRQYINHRWLGVIKNWQEESKDSL